MHITGALLFILIQHGACRTVNQEALLNIANTVQMPLPNIMKTIQTEITKLNTHAENNTLGQPSNKELQIPEEVIESKKKLDAIESKGNETSQPEHSTDIKRHVDVIQQNDTNITSYWKSLKHLIEGEKEAELTLPTKEDDLQPQENATRAASYWDSIRDYIGATKVSELKQEISEIEDSNAQVSQLAEQTKLNNMPVAPTDTNITKLTPQANITSYFDRLKRRYLFTAPFSHESNAVFASLLCRIIYWPKEVILKTFSDAAHKRILGEKTAIEFLDEVEVSEDSFFKVDEGSLRGICIANTHRKQIYVAFEGTSKLAHWYSNIVGSIPEPYFGFSGEVVDQALIHAGFQDAYHAIRAAAMTRLTAMAEEYPEFEIIITVS
jgi:hypothetical protein